MTRVDPYCRQIHFANGESLDFDLLLAVSEHVAPTVVLDSGLAENGWIPVDRATLATKFPDVYAVGDITSVGTPRAGVFSEGAGRVVAAQIISRFRDGNAERYQGAGHCYIEWGKEQIAEIAVNFLGGLKPTSDFKGATLNGVEDKALFGSSRKARWFGE